MPVLSLLRTTVEAAGFTAFSNILGQAIASYRNKGTVSISWVSVLHFFLYAIATFPPNILAQTFIETKFPGHIPTSAIASTSRDGDKTLENEIAAPETKLNKTNVVIKLLIDQTVLAAANTIAFSLFMAMLGGLSPAAAIQSAKQDFYPIMKMGWSIWPMASFANFTLIKTVEMRTLVGVLAGMAYTVYLSMLAAS